MKQSPANALLWVARMAWVLLAVVPHALDETSAVFVGAAWVVWALGVLAVVWQSPLSLTAIRVLAPLATMGLIGALVFSDDLDTASTTDALWPLLGIALSVTVMVVVFLPYYAAVHVQAAAYGAEQRFPLRVPVPLVLPMVVAWLVTIGLLFGTLFALAGEVWWLAVVLSIATVTVGKVVLERMHRFSRRWLVVVPAGLVVHDHLLLAETFMAKASSVTGVSIAAQPGEALDLTAVARGSVIIVQLRDTDDVILSPYLAKLLGIADVVHTRAYAVAPTLAAQALAALTRPPATT
jgi:hypothetical protein